MRKIDSKLIDRLTNIDDLLPLLDCIKRDNELRLEVRQNGDAFVYYRKGKALEIKNLKVDSKYGNVPDTKLAVSAPADYFEKMKKCIDNWLTKNPRGEFDTQQNIAKFNQDLDDKYIILDMEYAFEQNEIRKEDREKRGVFDLLGLERETGRIVFFEVKKGLGAIEGNSGIKAHIEDFEAYILKKNSLLFKANLIKDIENIINDKKTMGLIENFDVPKNLGIQDPELIFVFHPDNASEKEQFYSKLFKQEKYYKLIIVNNNNYKLNENYHI